MAQKTLKDQAGELYQRYKRLKDEHHKLRQQMEDFTRDYFMQHWTGEASGGEAEERVTLPTQTNTVDMAYSILMSQKRVIHAVPVRNTTECQEITSELEKFLNGVFYVNTLRAREDRVALALWDALVKKIGWVRYRWDEIFAKPEGMDNMPVVEAAEIPLPMAAPVPPEMQPTPATPMMVCKELPIVIDRIPPESVFVKWGGPKGIMYLFYAAERTVEDVESECGRLRMSKYRDMKWEDKAETKVEFIEYWGWDGIQLKTATMVDDEFVTNRQLREAKGYDNIPYVPIYCYRTASEQPHRRVKGLLDAMGDLVHIQERKLTQLNHALKMWAFMPLVANQGMGGDPIEVDTSIPNVVHLKRDQSLAFPAWPGTPPDFKWHATVIEDKIQETGFPATAYGQGAGAVSGYAISQYNEGARARLNLPRLNYALALTELCQGIVSLCANFAPEMGIPVFGQYKNDRFFMTLTGDQMKGHIIQVSIDSDMPGDQVRKAVIGGQLKAQNVLSERNIMENWLGVENVEDEQQQMARERAMKHPVVQMQAIVKALAEDDSPYAQSMIQEVLAALTQMKGPSMPQGAPQPSDMGAGPPVPVPPGVPSAVVPPEAQGTVLRQEVGLPPTEAEMTGVPPPEMM